jgi:pimeloyl-ACP methyl ester carboxylesterase
VTLTIAPASPLEQSRARYPDDEGFVERDGARLHYEVYGDGEPTILLLPTWSIIHSRHWKAQIHYLARHCRVLTFDGRGNGRSDRPRGVEAYVPREHAADALEIMDATGTEHAVVVGLSAGAQWGSLLAARHPERVLGAVFIGPAVWLGDPHPERAVYSLTEPLDTDEGWAKENIHYWRRDYRGYLEFFFGRVFNERHSTKQIEDSVGWGLETDPETLADTRLALMDGDPDAWREVYEGIRCPVLVIHGTADAIRPYSSGVALAELTGGRLYTMEGSGHCPHGRRPVEVNLEIRGFAESVAAAAATSSAAAAPPGRAR